MKTYVASLLTVLVTTCGLAPLASGQQQNATPTQDTRPDSDSEEVVSMNIFEVRPTADQGYVAKGSAGMKSDLPVADIPQSIDIVTRDVITDISENHKGSADTIKYVSPGFIPITNTEANEARGAQSTSTFLDGLPDPSNYGDLANIDSIDVLKGPEAVLYGTTAIAGTIIKNTKKPLDTQHDSFDLSRGSYNFYRGVVDSTGPLKRFPDGSLDYRFVGLFQRSNGFVKPLDNDDRVGLFPSFQLNFKNTIVRVAVDYLNIARENFAGEIMAPGPNGYTQGPWQGGGKYSSFRAPWESHRQHSLAYRGALIQRFSDSWNMHLYVEVANEHTNGIEARPNGNPDFVAGAMQAYELNYLTWSQWYQATCDFNGKFSILGTDWVTIFGGTAYDNSNHSTYYKYILGTFSLYGENPLAASTPGAFSQYTYLQDISTTDGTRFSPYLMQTVYLFNRRLILAGGSSYVYLRNNSEDNTKGTYTVGPNGEGNPYRLGAIYKPINGLSFYYNRSTTFSSQPGKIQPNGQGIGNTAGSVTEYGMRTDLFDNRITGTIDYFETLQTNIASADPDLTHGVFYFPSGTNTNKGVEAVLGIEPIRNWTIVGTYYSGKLINQAGVVASDAVNHSGSLLTKYSIKDGALKGWAIGANWYHQGRRWEAASSGYGWPAFSVAGVMLSYGQKNWSASLHVNNVQNKFYSDGGFSSLTWVDLAPPREFFLNLTYRFF